MAGLDWLDIWKDPVWKGLVSGRRRRECLVWTGRIWIWDWFGIWREVWKGSIVKTGRIMPTCNIPNENWNIETKSY